MPNKPSSDPWRIKVENFNPAERLSEENLFSLGNGYISQCGNFEEFYSGEKNYGTFVSNIQADSENAGIEAPESLVALPDWTSMTVRLNIEKIDLGTADILQYSSELNMLEGFSDRKFEIIIPEKKQVIVSVQRFISLQQPELAAIKYTVRSVDFEGRISFTPVIDGVMSSQNNSTQNAEWNVLQTRTQLDVAHLWLQIRGSQLQVCEALSYEMFKNNSKIKINPTKIEKQKVAGFSFVTDMKAGDAVSVNKYVAVLNSNKHPYQELPQKACQLALEARNMGWNELFEENSAAWKQKWNDEKLRANAGQKEIYSIFRQLVPTSVS